MWLIQKAQELIEFMNSESDEETDIFIDKEYKWVLGLACMYLKFDRKHLAGSCLQYLAYITICLYHTVSLVLALPIAFKTNFVLCSKTAYFIMLFQVSGTIIIMVLVKRKTIARYHRNMSKNFYDYNEFNGHVVEKYRKLMLRERMIIAAIPACSSIAAACVFVMSPICDKFGTFQPTNASTYINLDLPIPVIAYPFSTRDRLGYYSALTSQVMGGILLPVVIGGGAYFFVVLTGHIAMQLRILLYSLDHIETRAADCYLETYGRKMEINGEAKFADKRYAFCFEKCLNKNFEHHQVILSMFDDVKTTSSIPLCVAYATGTITIALSLLSNNVTELPGTTVSSMLLGVVEVGFMALFSMMGQQVTDLGDDLHEKVFSIRWYYMNERVKRSIRIFQTMSIKPMAITCAGVIPCNLETFAKVINSAYSYYNLVNAFNT